MDLWITVVENVVIVVLIFILIAKFAGAVHK